MSDFTKTKIGFAIALLAALFTVSPATAEWGSIGYLIFHFHLEIKHLYNFISIFLVLAVYFYGIQFLTERPMRVPQMFADISYAIAIFSPALYVILFLVVLSTDALAQITKSENLPAVLQSVLSAVAGALSVLPINWIRKIIANREKRSTAEENEKKAISSLERAKQLFEDGHYDLSVIECFKSIEVGARAALLERSHFPRCRSTIDLIDAAVQHGLIPKERVSLVHTIREQRNLAAHGVEPVTKEKAILVLEATRRILASITNPPETGQN